MFGHDGVALEVRLTRQKADCANGQITRKTGAVEFGGGGDTMKKPLFRGVKKGKCFAVIPTRKRSACQNSSSIITAKRNDVGDGSCPFCGRDD